MVAPAKFIGSLELRAFSLEELAAQKCERQLFELRAPFAYESPKFGRIVAPAGTVCDFASIPRFALTYLDDDDPRVLFASVIHDYLYSTAGYAGNGRVISRQEADEVFREACVAAGMRPTQAAVVYYAVRLGGASHWGKS